MDREATILGRHGFSRIVEKRPNSRRSPQLASGQVSLSSDRINLALTLERQPETSAHHKPCCFMCDALSPFHDLCVSTSALQWTPVLRLELPAAIVNIVILTIPTDMVEQTSLDILVTDLVRNGVGMNMVRATQLEESLSGYQTTIPGTTSCKSGWRKREPQVMVLG